VVDGGDGASDLMSGLGDASGAGLVADSDDDAFGRVAVDLDHLDLVPLNAPADFTIRVAGGDDAELAVSVQGEN